jgi:hypothetical protein
MVFNLNLQFSHSTSLFCFSHVNCRRNSSTLLLFHAKKYRNYFKNTYQPFESLSTSEFVNFTFIANYVGAKAK